MAQEEKFVIWDATRPAVRKVKARLDQLNEITPLPLLYVTKKENKVTRAVLSDEKSGLVGILLDKGTILCLKAMTKDDIKHWIDSGSVCNITEKNVTAWVKLQFANFLNARAATEQDIKLVKKISSDLSATLKILDYQGIIVPNFCWDYLGWLKKDACYLRHWDGETKIFHYLENFGDLLIFSDFSSNEIVKTTVLHEFFSAKQ